MIITEKDVEHVAKLARLELSSEEVKSYTKELDEIFEIANKLNDVDTEGVEPLSHPFEMINVFREDEPKKDPTVDDIVNNGPDTSEHSFVVPRILD